MTVRNVTELLTHGANLLYLSCEEETTDVSPTACVEKRQNTGSALYLKEFGREGTAPDTAGQASLQGGVEAVRGEGGTKYTPLKLS